MRATSCTCVPAHGCIAAYTIFIWLISHRRDIWCYDRGSLVNAKQFVFSSNENRITWNHVWCVHCAYANGWAKAKLFVFVCCHLDGSSITRTKKRKSVFKRAYGSGRETENDTRTEVDSMRATLKCQRTTTQRCSFGPQTTTFGSVSSKFDPLSMCTKVCCSKKVCFTYQQLTCITHGMLKRFHTIWHSAWAQVLRR